MKDFEIRCDESRLEKNNTLYGKFSLGPFLPGQGTTFGNALRRSLLSELSGLGITAFEIIGVMQEFSTLPGLRESVLDLSLNLKQIVLTGVLPFSTPPIGFLKVRGPAIIYAADLQLPAGVYCAAPKQYIGTLSSNGVLNLKFLVSVGKGHSTQPYSLYRSLSKVKLQPWKKENGSSIAAAHALEKNRNLHRPGHAKQEEVPTLFDDQWKNSNWKTAIHLRGNDKERQISAAEIEKTRHITSPKEGVSLQPPTVENVSSNMQSSGHQRASHDLGVFDAESTNLPLGSGVPVASPTHPTTIRELELKRQKVFNAGHAKQVEGNESSSTLTHTSEAQSAPIEKKGSIPSSHDNSHDALLQSQKRTPDVQVQRWRSELTERRSQKELNTKIAPISQIASICTEGASAKKMELGLENGGISYVNIQKQTFQRVNPHQVLPIDAVFTPVSQVNFLTQVNDRFETPRENVVLEIWTNGSIHPKRALEEAALSLVQNFDTLLKNIQQASSFDKGLRYNSHLLHKENLTKKNSLITGKFDLTNIPLHQAIYNLDIGNLNLSLETFILLKQAKIKNLAHLLKNIYSKEGQFFVKVEELSLQHDNTSGLAPIEKNWSEKESAINNIDKGDKGYSLYREQTKTQPTGGENFFNVCLNEKIMKELSNIFSQLGIKL